MTRLVAVVAAALGALLWLAAAHAQEPLPAADTNLQILIRQARPQWTDSPSVPVAGAEVRVTGAGQTQTARTNAEGKAWFTLDLGAYTIEIVTPPGLTLGANCGPLTAPIEIDAPSQQWVWGTTHFFDPDEPTGPNDQIWAYLGCGNQPAPPAVGSFRTQSEAAPAAPASDAPPPDAGQPTEGIATPEESGNTARNLAIATALVILVAIAYWLWRRGLLLAGGPEQQAAGAGAPAPPAANAPPPEEPPQKNQPPPEEQPQQPEPPAPESPAPEPSGAPPEREPAFFSEALIAQAKEIAEAEADERDKKLREFFDDLNAKDAASRPLVEEPEPEQEEQPDCHQLVIGLPKPVGVDWMIPPRETTQWESRIRAAVESANRAAEDLALSADMRGKLGGSARAQQVRDVFLANLQREAGESRRQSASGEDALAAAEAAVDDLVATQKKGLPEAPAARRITDDPFVANRFFIELKDPHPEDQGQMVFVRIEEEITTRSPDTSGRFADVEIQGEEFALDGEPRTVPKRGEKEIPLPASGRLEVRVAPRGSYGKLTFSLRYFCHQGVLHEQSAVFTIESLVYEQTLRDAAEDVYAAGMAWQADIDAIVDGSAGIAGAIGAALDMIQTPVQVLADGVSTPLASGIIAWVKANAETIENVLAILVGVLVALWKFWKRHHTDTLDAELKRNLAFAERLPEAGVPGAPEIIR